MISFSSARTIPTPKDLPNRLPERARRWLHCQRHQSTRFLEKMRRDFLEYRLLIEAGRVLRAIRRLSELPEFYTSRGTRLRLIRFPPQPSWTGTRKSSLII